MSQILQVGNLDRARRECCVSDLSGADSKAGGHLEKSSFTCLVVDAGCQLELGWSVGQKPWPLHVNSLGGQLWTSSQNTFGF